MHTMDVAHYVFILDKIKMKNVQSIDVNVTMQVNVFCVGTANRAVRFPVIFFQVRYLLILVLGTS